MALLADILAALDRVKIWKDLQTVPERVAALERRLSALEGGKVQRSGGPCPICETGNLKTVKVAPDPVMGDLGLQQHTLRCDNAACSHSETRQVDPAKA